MEPHLTNTGCHLPLLTPADEVVCLKRRVDVEDGDGDSTVQEQPLNKHPGDVGQHRVPVENTERLTEPVLHTSQQNTGINVHCHRSQGEKDRTSTQNRGTKQLPPLFCFFVTRSKNLTNFVRLKPFEKHIILRCAW